MARTLSTPARYTLSMLAAAVATLGLFLMIVLLIKFNGTTEKPEPRVSVTLDTVERPQDAEPIARAQKLQEQSRALKEHVEVPPSPQTKTTQHNQFKPTKNQTHIASKPSFDSIAPVELSMPDRVALAGHDTSRSEQASGARKGFGDTASISGDRQCTIIFEVGATKTEIASLQWIDCMNAKIVNAAEAEVYRWVRSADQNYMSLNPQTGDQIEFTYEEQ